MSQFNGDPPASPDNPTEPDDSARPRARSARCPLPPFKVLLHYDAAIELMAVVRTVMDLTRLCRAEATHKMWEAYHNGRSLILVTHRERAELYVEQFATRGLRTSIEPA